MLGQQADQRRSREERRVADRAHHRHAYGGAGRVVRRRAHPDREPERGTEAPQHRPGHRDGRRAAEQHEQQARQAEHGRGPQGGDPAVAFERRAPIIRATVIAATNTPKPIAPTASLVP